MRLSAGGFPNLEGGGFLGPLSEAVLDSVLQTFVGTPDSRSGLALRCHSSSRRLMGQIYRRLGTTST